MGGSLRNAAGCRDQLLALSSSFSPGVALPRCSGSVLFARVQNVGSRRRWRNTMEFLLSQPSIIIINEFFRIFTEIDIIYG